MKVPGVQSNFAVRLINTTAFTNNAELHKLTACEGWRMRRDPCDGQTVIVGHGHTASSPCGSNTRCAGQQGSTCLLLEVVPGKVVALLLKCADSLQGRGRAGDARATLEKPKHRQPPMFHLTVQCAVH